MQLRKADCGHWINFDLPQAGTQDIGPHVWPIYLCAECLARAVTTGLTPDPEPIRAKATLKSRED